MGVASAAAAAAVIEEGDSEGLVVTSAYDQGDEEQVLRSVGPPLVWHRFRARLVAEGGGGGAVVEEEVRRAIGRGGITVTRNDSLLAEADALQAVLDDVRERWDRQLAARKLLHTPARRALEDHLAGLLLARDEGLDGAALCKEERVVADYVLASTTTTTSSASPSPRSLSSRPSTSSTSSSRPSTSSSSRCYSTARSSSLSSSRPSSSRPSSVPNNNSLNQSLQKLNLTTAAGLDDIDAAVAILVPALAREKASTGCRSCVL
eukprot:jgi/Chlat1/1763/Chrsp134S02089